MSLPTPQDPAGALDCADLMPFHNSADDTLYGNILTSGGFLVLAVGIVIYAVRRVDKSRLQFRQPVQGRKDLRQEQWVHIWRKAAIVLAKCGQGGKPDVAFPSAQKLANNMPKGVNSLQAQFPEAFMELFGITKYKVAVAK